MNAQQSRIILLIEDNDDHAEITEFYIHECGKNLEVIRFRDGKEAIEHIVEIRHNRNISYPWLVLLDLNLPKYSGHEVLAKIKTEPLLKQIPVVIFTTSNSNKDIEQALKSGANTYIQKPAEPDEFFPTINQMINYWWLSQHELIVEQLNRYVELD
jgi:CheY-like chemotaxis protein